MWHSFFFFFFFFCNCMLLVSFSFLVRRKCRASILWHSWVSSHIFLQHWPCNVRSSEMWLCFCFSIMMRWSSSSISLFITLCTINNVISFQNNALILILNLLKDLETIVEYYIDRGYYKRLHKCSSPVLTKCHSYNSDYALRRTLSKLFCCLSGIWPTLKGKMLH